MRVQIRCFENREIPWRIVLCFSLSIILNINVNAQTYFTDPDDLSDAVNSSTNGGTFIVKDGTYNDFESTFENVANSENPIVIKAETVGGVTLTGESHFVFKKSAHITLEGFIFDCEGEDSLVKLEGCHHIRISKNVFELKTEESIKWVFVGGVWNDNQLPFEYPSHNNRIDHNVFKNKATPGHYITLDGSYEDTGSDEIYYQSQHDRIDHNYFKNNGPRAVNEQESIRIGWSEMSQSSGYTLVETNLFEDCDGDPEIVSVKSCDNIIRNNTFIGCYGTLSLRHGNRNRVEGNYFFGNEKPIGISPAGSSLYTGGIRIYGTDHVIINNYMEGLNGTKWDAPITLTLGDAIDGQSTSLSKHFRAERVTIAYNTLINNSHGIEIGFDNNNNYNKDLKDIIIANNIISGSENSLVEIVDINNDQGDQITWLDNLMYPIGSASILSGATSTVFDATALNHENPNLVYDEQLNTWRSSADTPIFENALTSLVVEIDIDGHERPALSNPGADHYSNDTIRFYPLTSNDVGPNATGLSTNSSFILLENTRVTAYPIPTNDKLNLRYSKGSVTMIEIIDLKGKVVLSSQILENRQYHAINTSELANGSYFLLLSNNKNLVKKMKIIVQH